MSKQQVVIGDQYLNDTVNGWQVGCVDNAAFLMLGKAERLVDIERTFESTEQALAHMAQIAEEWGEVLASDDLDSIPFDRLPQDISLRVGELVWNGELVAERL